MPNIPDIASIAALVADPTRSRMLTLLMDGRAQTATELALEGGVTPSTASSHLARLTAADLVAIAKQGRHRYYRIENPAVAAAIEGLMGIAPELKSNATRTGPRDMDLRRARVCYDHLAGEAAVRILMRLRERKLLGGTDETLALTEPGRKWCERVGIDLAALGARRRRICRPCLDWSERRTHLAGALGAALLSRLVALRYARADTDSRRVVLSPRGEVFVERLELAR